MKNVFTLLLAALMLVSLCACGNEPTDTTTTDVPETPAEAVKKIPLGETVSTDIVDFTLETAKFAHYLHSTSDVNYLNPTNDTNTIFAAKTGTCLVSMVVTITNKDRAGSLGFGGSSSDWNTADWKVIYNGEEFPLYDFDLNSDDTPYIRLSYAAYVDEDTHRFVEKVGSDNDLIRAGASNTYRMFGIIKKEVSALSDSFDLTVTVPSSNGSDATFTYVSDSEGLKKVDAAVQAAKDARNINSEANAEVDAETAASVTAALQGEWTYTDGGVDHKLTFSGNSLVVDLSVSTLQWSENADFSVRRDNLLLTYTTGEQRFLPYTYENGTMTIGVITSFE